LGLRNRWFARLLFRGRIRGALKRNDKTLVAGGWIQLHGTGPNFKSYNVRVKKGEFSFHLPDGTYLIDGFWDELTQNQLHLSYTFIVDYGKSFPDPLELIEPAHNVAGILKLYDGTLMDDLYLNLHSENEGMNYGYSTKVKNGHFSLFLADGNYVVDGFLDPSSQKKVQLKFALQVMRGISWPNPLKILVTKEQIQGAFRSHRD
jgi:hypothetical protein